MRGFPLFRIRGIIVQLHISFLLMLPLLAYLFAHNLQDAADLAHVPIPAGSPWLWGFFLALSLFASVLLHELAHSLYAIRTGGRVRSITLLLVGGVSELIELPKRPRDEAIMALIGPVTSLALGLLFFAIYRFLPSEVFTAKFVLLTLGSLNIFLGFFNLLPAFPMDGGRIVRALLVPKLGRVRATRIASLLGKGFALVFAIVGIFSLNLLLLLIAFFVYVGAEAEAQQTVIHSLLRNEKVRDWMSQYFTPISAELSAFEAVEQLLRSKTLSLIALEADGRYVGLLALEELEKVLPEERDKIAVRDLLQPTPTLSQEDSMSRALQLISEYNLASLAVVEAEHVIGVVRQADIVDGMRLRSLAASQRSLFSPWLRPQESS